MLGLKTKNTYEDTIDISKVNGLEQKLNQYAKSSDISNFVNEDTLSSYVKSSDIDTTLSSYAKTSDISDNYYNKEQVNSLLGNKKDKVSTGIVSNVDYIDNITNIQIQWTDPTDNYWKSTILVRKLGSVPTNSTDGTVVITETTKNQYSSTYYTDTLPDNSSENNVYYYKFFTVSEDNILNNNNSNFYVDGTVNINMFRSQLKNGTINASNIGDTITIHHDTYGDIEMQIVAYDDAELSSSQSATHTVTLLSKDIICKKQIDRAQNQYAITEDTVYRPDAIIMFNTSSTFAVSNTNNYLIDDISKTGTQRSWTSFNGQYVIRYNNSRWQRGTLTSATTYTMNYYLSSSDITSGTWLDSSSNSSSYIVTYIKKYYSLSDSIYTQKTVTLGDTVESNIYQRNIAYYTDNGKYRVSYGYNRYSQSGIRQWLNGSGSNWWSKQNLFDNPPTYSSETGFMDGFSDQFKNSLATVKVITTLNCMDSQGYNGYKYDVTEDKIFLPSYTQLFNSNNYSNTPQGNYWSYFDSNQKRIKQYNSSNYVYWMRSPSSSYASIVWDVYNGGYASNCSANNVVNVGAVVACVIKSI